MDLAPHYELLMTDHGLPLREGEAPLDLAPNYERLMTDRQLLITDYLSVRARLPWISPRLFDPSALEIYARYR